MLCKSLMLDQCQCIHNIVFWWAWQTSKFENPVRSHSSFVATFDQLFGVACTRVFKWFCTLSCLFLPWLCQGVWLHYQLPAKWKASKRKRQRAAPYLVENRMRYQDHPRSICPSKIERQVMERGLTISQSPAWWDKGQGKGILSCKGRGNVWLEFVSEISLRINWTIGLISSRWGAEKSSPNPFSRC